MLNYDPLFSCRTYEEDDEVFDFQKSTLIILTLRTLPAAQAAQKTPLRLSSEYSLWAVQERSMPRLPHIVLPNSNNLSNNIQIGNDYKTKTPGKQSVTSAG